MKSPGRAVVQRVAATGRPEQGLGETVRQLRTERSLSVRTLASRAGFSPSFISQIELNQASPSIASLDRLASALGVTLGAFFRQAREASPGGSAITRSGGRPPLTSWWSRAQLEALTPMGKGRPFEAVMVSIAAGGRSGKRPYAPLGYDFAIVFEGQLRLTMGDEVHMLARGDTATFDPKTPYRWENRGKSPARLVIVSSRLMR